VDLLSKIHLNWGPINNIFRGLNFYKKGILFGLFLGLLLGPELNVLESQSAGLLGASKGLFLIVFGLHRIPLSNTIGSIP